MKSFRKNIIALILSIALGNIALFSIINFHQYRIFEKQLVKLDEYFIKKDEKTIAFFDKQTDTKYLPLFSLGSIDTKVEFFIFGKNLFFPFIFDNEYNEIFNQVPPTRGPPIF